ncbi:hypothetical protein ACLOJK_009795 [Asimina triloba]
MENQITADITPACCSSGRPLRQLINLLLSLFGRNAKQNARGSGAADRRSFLAHWPTLKLMSMRVRPLASSPGDAAMQMPPEADSNASNAALSLCEFLGMFGASHH